MIRILRLAGAGTFISGRVFDDSFACNLYPELSVDQVDLATWLDSIFGRERLRPGNRIVHESFRSTTRGFDFLCPNYVAISVAPLLLHLRNRSRAPIRLLLIAHAPGAYALEWALLRPLLRNGDVIVAPTRSARGVINFLSPELTAYTRVIPHPVRPLPYSRFGYRPLVVSLSRVHPSKLLHRQIEAIALVRQRGNRTVRMRIAGPVHDPGAWGMSSYARSLSAKIRRLQLEDCVELVGEIDRLDQKSRFISEARLLVNLSVTIEESFGKAIVEALGRGVPVLGTRWNGLPETIGAGGVSVPVDVTPLGMDVSVERIAAAIELLLDDPPSCEKCRDEALRFQPQRVRRLYREKLDAAMQASTANGPTQNGAPERDAPASPSSGLLGVTAPLTQYSWSELFALHLRDAARLRETLAGVAHRDTSEADELRSLLIFGVKAPVGRLLAGVSLDGTDQPTGRERPMPTGGPDFLSKVGTAALSRATLASRLACLSALANAGRLEPLRLGLEAMRADGLRSSGLRHLEIEALRLDGQYQRAFQMHIEQEDPLYWGELAAHRLRQLAAVCRGWGLAGMALPWLREWLERFPDSPDSAMVHLDRSANAIALGPDLFEEARRAFEAGRQLLGDSVNLTQLEALIRRGEAVQQTPPWPVIARMVGLITDVTPIGRSTFTARAAGRKLVVKQMTYDRDPDRCMELLIRLSQMPSPFCPRPLGAVVENGRSWYALFEWVNGERPAPADQDEVVWHSALTLLRRMWACEVVPQWRLESIWLDRLGEYLSDERAAAFVLRSLRRTIPEGGSTLAHGDFSHQNFIRDSGGIVLVDWEEIGSAAPGFDAGWMLARARLGVGMRSHQEVFGALIAAGFCESNLVWFERLGLLRLLFHARTLPMNACLRRRVLTAVRGAVSECVVVMKSRSTQWELSAQ